MVQRRQVSTDGVSLIHDYRDIRDATKSTARTLDLLVIRVQKVDARFVSRFSSGSALDRDTQDLIARRSTCDEIDSCVVDIGALETPLREPIEDQGLAEVSRDLRVAGTLEHVEEGG